MRIISERSCPAGRSAWKSHAVAAGAVAVTALVGGRAVDADSAWYKALDKPPWQPPPWAFGAVWTPLYASIAWAAGRGLSRSRRGEHARLAASLGTNLALNAGWNYLFFRCRSPRAGLAGTVLLDAGNAHLIVRTAAIDRTAAVALAPYAAWCLFATALNLSLVRRNPRR
ncbi:TspO/MBR family protein [Streptomyces sp. NPDC005533]|uniref:TspO/MBR family protein n=1 Tax=Streptomyces sp. NPDC005533 TaxID=3364723 RepID=UPI0036CD3726